VWVAFVPLRLLQRLFDQIHKFAEQSVIGCKQQQFPLAALELDPILEASLLFAAANLEPLSEGKVLLDLFCGLCVIQYASFSNHEVAILPLAGQSAAKVVLEPAPRFLEQGEAPNFAHFAVLNLQESSQRRPIMRILVLAKDLHPLVDEPVEGKSSPEAEIESKYEIVYFLMVFEHAESAGCYFQVKSLRVTSNTYQIVPISRW